MLDTGDSGNGVCFLLGLHRGLPQFLYHFSVLISSE